MNLEDVRERLREIEAIRDDDETAHRWQDALYEDVLEALAAGGDPLLAAEALKVRDINFERWCA